MENWASDFTIGENLEEKCTIGTGSVLAMSNPTESKVHDVMLVLLCKMTRIVLLGWSSNTIACLHGYLRLLVLRLNESSTSLANLRV
jgi:hypothetical protein